MGTVTQIFALIGFIAVALAVLALVIWAIELFEDRAVERAVRERKQMEAENQTWGVILELQRDVAKLKGEVFKR